MENQLNFAAISDEELAEINGGGINIWRTAGRLAGNIAIGAATGALGGPAGIAAGAVGGMVSGFIQGPVKNLNQKNKCLYS